MRNHLVVPRISRLQQHNRLFLWIVGLILYGSLESYYYINNSQKRSLYYQDSTSSSELEVAVVDHDAPVLVASVKMNKAKRLGMNLFSMDSDSELEEGEEEEEEVEDSSVSNSEEEEERLRQEEEEEEFEGPEYVPAIRMMPPPDEDADEADEEPLRMMPALLPPPNEETDEVIEEDPLPTTTTITTKSPATATSEAKAKKNKGKREGKAKTPDPPTPTTRTSQETTNPKRQKKSKAPQVLPASSTHAINNPNATDAQPLRVLAYSLYGSKPRYIRGMVNVAKHIPKVFPANWQVWIYHDNSVPERALGRIQSAGSHIHLWNVESDTKEFPKWIHRDLSPPTWRFLVASNPKVDAYAIRDSDSLPSHREFLAVQEFIASNKKFHLMRDHPWHHPHLSCPILAGMWGGRSWSLPQMKSLLKDYYSKNSSVGKKQREVYGTDQDFLWNIILPLIYNDVLQHDSYNCREANAVAFPIAREDSDADDNNPFWYVGNTGAQHAGPIQRDHFTQLMIDARPRFDACMRDRKQKEEALTKQGIASELFGKYFNTTFTGKLSGSYIESTQLWNERVRGMNNSYY